MSKNKKIAAFIVDLMAKNSPTLESTEGSAPSISGRENIIVSCHGLDYLRGRSESKKLTQPDGSFIKKLRKQLAKQKLIVSVVVLPTKGRNTEFLLYVSKERQLRLEQHGQRRGTIEYHFIEEMEYTSFFKH